MSTAKPHCNQTPSSNRVFSVVAKNAGANLMRQAVSWLVVLFLPPLLVRLLDKPAYATWVLILQIGAYVAFFDGGIQLAISRFVARAEELQDRHYLSQTVSSAGAILLGGGLLTLIATLLCSWLLQHLFPAIPKSLLGGARDALLVVGVSLAIGLPFSTLAGTFLGLQMNEVNATAGAAGKLLGAAGAAWAAWRHDGIAIMAAWVAFGNLLQAAILYLWARRERLHELCDAARVTSASIREFVRFCYALFLTQASSLLITGLDIPIVAAFDFSAAAYYAIASTASNLLGVPQGAIVTSLIPVASGMSAMGDPERMGSALLRITRYATAILCLLAMPLLCLLHPLLQIWVGADYAGHAAPFAELLIAAQFLRLTLMPYAVVGFGAGQQDQMLASPIAEGVVNCGVSLIAVQILGAEGVALGTLIGALVGIACHFAISMRRTTSLRFSRRTMLQTGILKPITFTMPGFLFAFWISHSQVSILVDAVVTAGAQIGTAFLLWKAVFSIEERREMMVIGAGLFRRRRARALSNEV